MKIQFCVKRLGHSGMQPHEDITIYTCAGSHGTTMQLRIRYKQAMRMIITSLGLLTNHSPHADLTLSKLYPLMWWSHNRGLNTVFHI
jgi:hypothetical protein